MEAEKPKIKALVDLMPKKAMVIFPGWHTVWSHRKGKKEWYLINTLHRTPVSICESRCHMISHTLMALPLHPVAMKIEFQHGFREDTRIQMIPFLYNSSNPIKIEC